MALSKKVGNNMTASFSAATCENLRLGKQKSVDSTEGLYNFLASW
jgi:hypothetical protein